MKALKAIKLFKIILENFTKGDNEKAKFNKTIQLFDFCKIIFTDINQGNQNILNKWQDVFKNVID